MNRINELFLKKNKGILSVYFTAGYPERTDTLPVLRELQLNGVDMVELGMPFSDPMADGPVIQVSNQRALNNGMTLRVLFDQLKEMRREVTIPVILMGYLNPVIQFGFEAFCQKCQEVGVDGLILPDLPFSDYMEEYKPVADRYGVKIIMLITPETSDDRIRFIDTHTDGFIYMVSSASTTGAQSSFDSYKQDYFRRIDAMNLRNPRLIGFGISNKSTFDSACAAANGAIIGSRFVKSLEEHQGDVKGAVADLLERISK